jgi:hypothetical protein
MSTCAVPRGRAWVLTFGTVGPLATDVPLFLTLNAETGFLKFKESGPLNCPKTLALYGK